jgi:molecular chaperone GrpE (heat shock protein)
MKATSVRRRTKQEIEDQKAAALAKEEAIQDKLKTIDRLHIELQKVSAAQEANQKNEEAIQSMLQAGFIAPDGNGGYMPGPNVGAQGGE